MKLFKHPLFAFSAIYLVAGFLLFGRTLHYSFVFDDHTKIIQNPAMADIRHVLSSFWDRDTQSKTPELNTHTYRPVLYLCLYVDKLLWGYNPAGYRAKNIVIHSFNAALVAWLAMLLFAAPPAAAFIGGALFLVHPAQIESVVWIVERSNVLAMLFMLFALWAWHVFLEKKKSRWLFVCGAWTALGLLTREIAIVIPALAFFLIKPPFAKRHWVGLVVLGVLVAAYLAIRTVVLGQVGQQNFYGDSFFSHTVVVAKAWLAALQFLVVPFPQTINHQFTAAALYGPRMLAAYFVAVVWLGLCALAWVRNRPVGILLVLISIMWLPTSQLVPMAKPFAERFLYPVLVPVCWLAAYGLAGRMRATYAVFAAALIGWFSFLGWRYMPAWRNDVTLWAHAVELDPDNYLNWYHLAESEKITAWMVRNLYRRPEAPGWHDRAEHYYRQSLKCLFPSNFGAKIYLGLADINLKQGKFDEAEYHAQRGLALRPDLIGLWQNIRRWNALAAEPTKTP